MIKKADGVNFEKSQFTRITRWAAEEELIDTQYGSITFLEWLSNERSRIQSGTGRELEIRKDPDGKVALFSKINDDEDTPLPGVRRYSKKLSRKETHRFENLHTG